MDIYDEMKEERMRQFEEDMDYYERTGRESPLDDDNHSSPLLTEEQMDAIASIVRDDPRDHWVDSIGCVHYSDKIYEVDRRGNVTVNTDL